MLLPTQYHKASFEVPPKIKESTSPQVNVLFGFVMCLLCHLHEPNIASYTPSHTWDFVKWQNHYDFIIFIHCRKHNFVRLNLRSKRSYNLFRLFHSISSENCYDDILLLRESHVSSISISISTLRILFAWLKSISNSILRCT